MCKNCADLCARIDEEITLLERVKDLGNPQDGLGIFDSSDAPLAEKVRKARAVLSDLQRQAAAMGCDCGAAGPGYGLPFPSPSGPSL